MQLNVVMALNPVQELLQFKGGISYVLCSYGRVGDPPYQFRGMNALPFFQPQGCLLGERLRFSPQFTWSTSMRRIQPTRPSAMSASACHALRYTTLHACTAALPPRVWVCMTAVWADFLCAGKRLHSTMRSTTRLYQPAIRNSHSL